MSIWTVKVLAIVMFVVIMTAWGFVWSGFVHWLPQGAVNLFAVGVMCFSVGFLIGQRHGIQR